MVYKIANPTILARIPKDELEMLMRGYGYEPHFVEGDEPEAIAPEDGGGDGELRGGRSGIFRKRRAVRARQGTEVERARWPMIVLRSPKGWTGAEGSSWQEGGETSGGRTRCRLRIRLPIRGAWPRWRHGCGVYKPEELFDEHGTLMPELQAMAPEGKTKDYSESACEWWESYLPAGTASVS